MMPDGSTQTVFWQGPGNYLFEQWFLGGAWNGPVDVSASFFGGGAPLYSAPVITITTSGTQILFWRGPWNHVFEAWFDGHWNGPVDATASYFGGNAPLSSVLRAPRSSTTARRSYSGRTLEPRVRGLVERPSQRPRRCHRGVLRWEPAIGSAARPSH